MKAIEIHNGSWVAENNVIRPLNTNEKPEEVDYYMRKSDGVNWGDFLSKQHADFESFAKKHTYATDLSGIYHADQLGEVVWQIEHTAGWSTLREEEVALYVNSNATTRQFITTKPISKETTPTAGLQVDDKIKTHINVTKDTLSNKSIGVKIEIGSNCKTVSADEAKELLYKLKKHLYIR